MSTLKKILERRGMGKQQCCPDCGSRVQMQEGGCPDCGINYGLSMGAKDAPGMSEAKTEKEEQPTSDFKLDKAGRKIKASKIIFSSGEDDSTKRVQENMKTAYKDLVGAYSALRLESLQLEDEINEVLSKDAAAGEWISDFVHSDNPKFASKSKEKRKQMALAAYYAKQKNEEVDIDEGTGSLKPGWMLKKDSELAKKVKANQDLNKKREASYGDKEAGKSVKEEVIDELSVDTLKSYDKKATMDYAVKRLAGDDVEKRRAGVKNARAKLAKEDLELDEVDDALNKRNAALAAFDKKSTADYWKSHAELKKHDPRTAKPTDKSVKEDLELAEAEKEYKPSTAQMGHAGKTTIKHIKNPDVTQRMAAHDVKSYADRIALLKDAKRKGNLKEDGMQESVFDYKNNPRETKDKTKTSTYHDVKKVSTGTVYTKQFDKDGTSKGSGDDAAKKAEGAVKRGRGRPKKDRFAESVEILMSLSEEQFDSMMEEGFDAFFEAYEQIDELSKDTLKSYVKKAAHSASNTGAEFGSRHAAGQEVERFANRHMADKFGNQDKMKAMVGASQKEVEAAREKSMKRVSGIKQAVDKLTK